jgi:hypothetical protein
MKMENKTFVNETTLLFELFEDEAYFSHFSLMDHFTFLMRMGGLGDGWIGFFKGSFLQDF